MAKMKSYATFARYLEDQPARNRPVLRALRSFVRETTPGLEESVKWGNGCWLAAGAPIAYVYSDKDHVQFGFIRGSALRDPLRLLQGNGRYVRHVKVHSAADIDRRAFGALLGQAVRLGGIARGLAKGAKRRGKDAGGSPAAARRKRTART